MNISSTQKGGAKLVGWIIGMINQIPTAHVAFSCLAKFTIATPLLKQPFIATRFYWFKIGVVYTAVKSMHESSTVPSLDKKWMNKKNCHTFIHYNNFRHKFLYFIVQTQSRSGHIMWDIYPPSLYNVMYRVHIIVFTSWEWFFCSFKIFNKNNSL